MLELLAIASVGILAAGMLAKYPRAAMTVWLTTMVLVPVWIEVRLIATLPPLSLVFLMLLPAVIYANGYDNKWRLSRGDVAFATFTVLAGASFFFENAPQYAFSTIFTSFLPAYLIGRRLAPAVGWAQVNRMIAIAATVVAAWAIIELVFDWHVFEEFLGTTGDTANWHLIQQRGDFVRSEGAFGHSIALGGFLALALPFVIASSHRLWARCAMIFAILVGIAASFSRAALLTAAAVMLLSLIGFRRTLDRASRRLLWWVVVLTAAIGVPFIIGILSQVEDDFTASTNYRVDLLGTILTDMRPFGQALGVQQDGAGRYFYHSFGSIDNAWVQTILQFGWVPLLVALVVCLGVLVRILRGRDVYPAHIAFVTQLGMVWTVALITQYGSAIWMVAGMCGALALHSKESHSQGEYGLPELHGRGQQHTAEPYMASRG